MFSNYKRAIFVRFRRARIDEAFKNTESLSGSCAVHTARGGRWVSKNRSRGREYFCNWWASYDSSFDVVLPQYLCMSHDAVFGICCVFAPSGPLGLFCAVRASRVGGGEKPPRSFFGPGLKCWRKYFVAFAVSVTGEVAFGVLMKLLWRFVFTYLLAGVSSSKVVDSRGIVISMARTGGAGVSSRVVWTPYN